MTTDLAIVASSSELVASIEAARALLDAGDVERALKLSTVVYDQAKAAAGSAERVRASRELVEKARRMQAEALKIESLCYVAMADAVDAAQALGRVSRGGRPSQADVSTPLKLADVGVDRKRLHDARRIRDGVRAEPDFVERVIEERLAQGLEPSRKWLRDRSAAATVRAPQASRATSAVLLSGERLASLKWYRLSTLIARYERELAVLRRISEHCVPADDRESVEEVVGTRHLALLSDGVAHE